MNKKKGIPYALLAAALYALNAPFSKYLLSQIPPAMMAALLYLGAGIGVFAMGLITKKNTAEKALTKKDFPYTAAMIVLDILAPILLMLGLDRTTAANVSLLNNFEIVATALIALLFFKERISRRLWCAIALVTAASLILSFESTDSLRFSVGSLYVLLACVCWGLENNCTRALSDKNPMQIVILKGIFSGLGSLIVALFAGEKLTAWAYVPLVLLLGFVAYGLSIYFYIYAQRSLGAAKTGAYYAVSPFIAAGLSMLLFAQPVTLSFVLALVFMAGGAFLAAKA